MKFDFYLVSSTKDRFVYGVKKILNQTLGLSRLVSMVGSLWTRWVLWLSNLPGCPKALQQITRDNPEWPYSVTLPGRIVKMEGADRVYYGLEGYHDIMIWIADYLETNMPHVDPNTTMVCVSQKLNRKTFGVDWHFGFVDPEMAMAFRFTWKA